MHEVFERNRLFTGLSDEVKATIYWNGQVLEVKAGEVIITEGAPNADMYLLLEGDFKVSRPDRPDRISGVTLGYRGPGDLIGEYSLLDGLPAATVTVEEPGRLFRIGHDALRDLLAPSPEISSVMYRNMLGYLVTRLRAQDDELDFFVL